MAEPTLVLFDDDVARAWLPLTLTRPAGDLLFGTLRGWERAERRFGGQCAGFVSSAELSGFDEPDAPEVLDPAALPEGDILFLSARAIPDWRAPRAVLPGSPATVMLEGQPCGWWAPAGSPRPPASFFRDPASAADASPGRITLEGRMLRHVWELVSGNTEQISRDVAALCPAPSTEPVRAAGVSVLGESRLVVGQDVLLEPDVVLDLDEGPIWLDDGACVRAFTRLAGPAYIGRGTTILGGALECVSIGPACKVRGEVETSVIHGYTNKAHSGFLGHAYLGRWVNLGALTTNSDLKNNYAPVRIWTPDGETDTGETKMGCLLGDHVKTGIGTVLNTGTVIGAGSNLFGGAMPPRVVPPFSWGEGGALAEYRLEKFLETAAVVMERRGVVLSDGQRALLAAAFERGRAGV